MRRRSSQSAFSLFAFQDIITSVMGIMVLITLILALELMERTVESPPVQTAVMIEDIRRINEEMAQEIVKLQSQLDNSSEEIFQLPSLSAELLSDELEKLAQDNEQKRKGLSQVRIEMVSRSEKLNNFRVQENSRRSGEQVELDKLLAKIDELKEVLRQTEATDRVFFRSGLVGKRTYLVEVSSSGFVAAEIGVQSRPTSFSSPTDFQKWIESLSTKLDAIYLVAKPGGTENLLKAQESIKSRGMEYGYSIVSKTQTLIDPKIGAGTP